MPRDSVDSRDFLDAAAVLRRPVRFGDGIFGWYHCTGDAFTRVEARDVVAVLCPPSGPEYTRAHRTLRTLADRFALAGMPAMRFDYLGTGDSAGDDDVPDALPLWRASIVAAIREARRLSGRPRVCLVGVRLGATLAALESRDADLLAMWNPVVSGRAYVRELRAMALTSGSGSGSGAASVDDRFECGGWRLFPETLSRLAALDLTAPSLALPPRVLLLSRDDLPTPPLPFPHDPLPAAGWNAMMADHQFTVVPHAALETLVAWVATPPKPGPGTGQVLGTGVGQVPPAGPATPETPGPGTGQVLGTGVGQVPGPPVASREIHEIDCLFGPGQHLFGILSRPPEPTCKPAIVLLGAGSIHHTGPHRLYVRLARELARRGHVVLRFDFEGIGDSVTRGSVRENHPYNESTMEDLRAALDFLAEEHGCQRVVLAGVCSGAYNAYRAGHELADRTIERLVLVNPWTFAWREGMSLATTISHYGDVAAYGESMRSAARWRRLLRGEVDVARIVRTMGAQAVRKTKGWLVEAPLARNLRRIEAFDRRVNVILSDGEPAMAILSTEAPRTFRRGLRRGSITLDRVRGGDHTFTRAAHRDELVEMIVRMLG